ncbi:OmpA family protein [Flavobacterium sp. TAB 87]|uniref:OmpA family protein n=1 Tax=Flavobacterium sp. TAB 87 TaxID=1729581 RepID=UPI00076D10AB|nr:OmpA family protein [Flavobacterium sp. TAB 87]KVV13590.1 15 kDa peptidoglycan-associated lipoprotein [Flavobacterium sp. TAB 87]
MVRKVLVFILFASSLSAQKKSVETVYFDFDKYTLSHEQTTIISTFIQDIDTSKIESIQIYGYCDDRGNDEYNYRLSTYRVQTVQEALEAHGFNKSKIIVLEGKGRIIVQKDSVEDLQETRSKNRRVDMLLVKKNNYGQGVRNSFRDELQIGTYVSLASVQFKIGSSRLTREAAKVLDNVADILNEKKTLNFEIQGHVCCTPERYEDGIDRETKERRLSWNRAKSVYLYLISKKVSRSRMTYQGFGNQFPLEIGDDRDRRVDFKITKI